MCVCIWNLHDKIRLYRMLAICEIVKEKKILTQCMYYITIFDDDGGVEKHVYSVHRSSYIIIYVYNKKLTEPFSITIGSPAFSVRFKRLQYTKYGKQYYMSFSMQSTRNRRW